MEEENVAKTTMDEKSENNTASDDEDTTCIGSDRLAAERGKQWD